MCPMSSAVERLLSQLQSEKKSKIQKWIPFLSLIAPIEHKYVLYLYTNIYTQIYLYTNISLKTEIQVTWPNLGHMATKWQTHGNMFPAISISFMSWPCLNMYGQPVYAVLQLFLSWMLVSLSHPRFRSLPLGVYPVFLALPLHLIRALLQAVPSADNCQVLRFPAKLYLHRRTFWVSKKLHLLQCFNFCT